MVELTAGAFYGNTASFVDRRRAAVRSAPSRSADDAGAHARGAALLPAAERRLRGVGARREDRVRAADDRVPAGARVALGHRRRRRRALLHRRARAGVAGRDRGARRAAHAHLRHLRRRNGVARDAPARSVSRTRSGVGARGGVAAVRAVRARRHDAARPGRGAGVVHARRGARRRGVRGARRSARARGRRRASTPRTSPASTGAFAGARSARTSPRCACSTRAGCWPAATCR